jgi:hypothetical protein
LKRNGYDEITQYELAYFFNKASLKFTEMDERNISFQSCRCLLNPEMFTETEFEVNEEASKMTNKEFEGYNHAVTSVSQKVNTQNVV